MEKIITYDCTLRDGEQGEGIALSIYDKLRIVERLDAFGIDYIEAGYPASNPKNAELFRQLAELPLKHAKIVAFGSLCHKDTPAADDAGMADLLATQAPVIALVGKAWDEQVTRVLQTSLEENLRMIADSIQYLVSQGREVVFDAEHFFDGYKANPEYALQCITVAVAAGARTVSLCETNGGCLPHEVEKIVADAVMSLSNDFCQAMPVIGIHAHNDCECAVANSLAAVRAGARQVQGTVGGIGERVGNADILTIIANLELKMGYECVGAEALTQLSSVAQFVADTCNTSVWSHRPYVGSAAFAHKGGLHASAMARFPGSYEHVSPALVGNRSRAVVSELASKASLVAKARDLGIELEEYPDRIPAILEEIKAREAQGYSYEVADGSLAMLILRQLGLAKTHFALESFRVIVDDYEDKGALAKDAMSEATIKIHVGDERFVATGEGSGPVGALDNALRLAITRFFPEVEKMELIDFKVRILEENVGCGATTRVAILTSDGEASWGTIGVSENIIEASWNALVDSVEYGLVRMGK